MTRKDAKEKLLEVMSVRYDKKDHVCLKSFIDDIEVFVLSKLEQQNAELQARVKALEKPKTCEGCAYEKQSNPLYFHCLGCNRAKHLNDKFHDKHEPCKG